MMHAFLPLNSSLTKEASAEPAMTSVGRQIFPVKMTTPSLSFRRAVHTRTDSDMCYAAYEADSFMYAHHMRKEVTCNNSYTSLLLAQFIELSYRNVVCVCVCVCV